MSEFDLVIKFRGLCAFVPRKDGRRAWVYLVKALRESIQDEWKGVRAHQAGVKLDLANLRVKWPDLEHGQKFKVPQTGRVMWLLENADLFILPGGKEYEKLKSDLKIIGWEENSDGVSLPIPEVKIPTGSFAYLSCLERACAGRKLPSGGGQIIPGLLRRNVEASLASLVAARVPLMSGELSAPLYGQDDGRPVVWRFRPYKGEKSRGDHRQILATEVHLTIPIDYDFVRLEVRNLQDSSKLEGQLDLQYAGVGPKRVTIEILNEETDEFFFESERPRFDFKKPRKEDQITEAYYRLVINPPPKGDKPIPVADYVIGAKDSGIAESSPPCSPVRFLGVEEPQGQWDK